MTTKSRSIDFFWPNESILHLCMLIDSELIDTPFLTWREQEAFEIILDLGKEEVCPNCP